jgi:hypothetical protein
LLPEYFQGYDGQDMVLKNFEGKIFRYPDTFGAQQNRKTNNGRTL